MALVTVRAARGVESISDDALPQTASPPTPLVVAESLNDVVRHARVALVWIIVQAAAILDHEQPAFGRQPAAPLRAALVGDDNFASPDQRCVVIIPRELHDIGVGSIARSEERRVGRECGMTCRYRGWAYR